jgi:hypothetical protein
MATDHKPTLKALTIAVLAASAFAIAIASMESLAVTAVQKRAPYQGLNRSGPLPRFGNQSWTGNVTIDSAQAKALVNAAISNFRVGTVTSSRTGWLVPIEDGKGVVASIEVTKVSASTSEQAKAIVEESLRKGWKAGEPKLMRTMYIVPLLDSKEATIAYVNVDGRSGEIMRRPSTILTVTSEQARAIVSNAIKEFSVGEAKDIGSMWMVSIKYRNEVVMSVALGKVNTPTSDDAVKAVQTSLGKGWSAGEPKRLQHIYNVPILDVNGNTVGAVRVDGRTGSITMTARPSR